MNNFTKFHGNCPSGYKVKLNLTSAIELSETAVLVYNFVQKPHRSELLRWRIWPTFPLNFLRRCSQKMRLYFFYTVAQKSQKWPKAQIKGVLLKGHLYALRTKIISPAKWRLSQKMAIDAGRGNTDDNKLEQRNNPPLFRMTLQSSDLSQEAWTKLFPLKFCCQLHPCAKAARTPDSSSLWRLIGDRVEDSEIATSDHKLIEFGLKINIRGQTRQQNIKNHLKRQHGGDIWRCKTERACVTVSL